MERIKAVRRAISFKKTAQRLFDTEDGKLVLAYLKDSYVDNTALGRDSNETYYKLGQKELIQSLIKSLNEPDELDDIIVKQMEE